MILFTKYRIIEVIFQNFSNLKVLEINSPTHWIHHVCVDDEDYELVLQYQWCVHKRRKFYAVTNIGKKTVSMHNLIMGDKMIDHKDNNGLNNCRNNLRKCSNAENLRNRGKQKNNQTGFKGVHFCNRSKRFISKITVDGKIIFLGSFENPELAAKAYDKGAIKYHNNFSNLNFKSAQL